MSGPEADLFDVVRQLGEDEVRVLIAIAKRLAMGRGQYGPLDVQGDRVARGPELGAAVQCSKGERILQSPGQRECFRAPRERRRL